MGDFDVVFDCATWRHNDSDGSCCQYFTHFWMRRYFYTLLSPVFSRGRYRARYPEDNRSVLTQNRPSRDGYADFWIILLGIVSGYDKQREPSGRRHQYQEISRSRDSPRSADPLSPPGVDADRSRQRDHNKKSHHEHIQQHRCADDSARCRSTNNPLDDHRNVDKQEPSPNPSQIVNNRCKPRCRGIHRLPCEHAGSHKRRCCPFGCPSHELIHHSNSDHGPTQPKWEPENRRHRSEFAEHVRTVCRCTLLKRRTRCSIAWGTVPLDTR